MKVLLLANPPMGDKLAARLSNVKGVEVDYRRMQKIAAQGEAVAKVEKGAWVLAMNVNGAGAGFKEAARTRGAHYLSVPPSWSLASQALEEAGFFREVHEERRNAGLTHHPLAVLANIDGRPVVDAVTDQLIEKAKASSAVLAALAGKGIVPDVDPNKRAERMLDAVAATTGIPRRREPTPEARRAGNEAMQRKAAERKAYARELFEKEPHLSPQMANQMVAQRFGRSTSEQALYKIRREVCEAKKLPPPPGSYGRPRGAPPPVAHTTPADVAAWASTMAKKHVERPLPQAEDPGLDALTDLKAAISLMWHEAKRAGVTLLTVTGSPAAPPKVTVEREVRVFEKGDLKVDM